MYEELLKEHVDSKTKYGERPQPPCDEPTLARLRERSERELGAEVPEAYDAFLRTMNGLDSNGLVIYAAETTPVAGQEDLRIEGFVDANLGYRDEPSHRGFLYFAESGTSFYALDLEGKTYRLLDRQSHSPMEEFASLEALLARALEENRP
jgi:hypothetical protein